MKLGCRYAVSGLFSVLGLVLGLSGACAQPQPQPLDHAPEGRRMPGWLVDSAEYQYQSQAPKGIERYGIRGDRSIPTESELNEFNGSGSHRFTIYYGQAFLKVDESGPYTFSISGNIVKADVFTSCQSDVRVSNVIVVSGIISNTRGTKPYSPSIGTARLSVGYYKIEYIVACGFVSRMNYKIEIRSPTDLSARYFKPDELFFVVK